MWLISDLGDHEAVEVPELKTSSFFSPVLNCSPFARTTEILKRIRQHFKSSFFSKSTFI